MTMPFRNTADRYGIVAMLFHWVMAIIVLTLLIVGLYMTGLPIGAQKLKIYGLHKATGILVLLLVTLRVLWRITSRAPHLQMLPRWERIAAQSVHFALYAFMVAMPLSGWMMSSAAGIPVSFFGLFVLPSPIEANDTLRVLFRQTHGVLGYGLIAAILLHVMAALKHHFIDKDTILKRMLP